jgi:hypothetical protein
MEMASWASQGEDSWSDRFRKPRGAPYMSNCKLLNFFTILMQFFKEFDEKWVLAAALANSFISAEVSKTASVSYLGLVSCWGHGRWESTKVT